MNWQGLPVVTEAVVGDVVVSGGVVVGCDSAESDITVCGVVVCESVVGAAVEAVWVVWGATVIVPSDVVAAAIGIDSVFSIQSSDII